MPNSISSNRSRSQEVTSKGRRRKFFSNSDQWVKDIFRVIMLILGLLRKLIIATKLLIWFTVTADPTNRCVVLTYKLVSLRIAEPNLYTVISTVVIVFNHMLYDVTQMYMFLILIRYFVVKTRNIQ